MAKLKDLRLKDWGPHIDTALPVGRITVVQGANETGKTRIGHGIQWLFTGTTPLTDARGAGAEHYIRIGARKAIVSGTVEVPHYGAINDQIAANEGRQVPIQTGTVVLHIARSRTPRKAELKVTATLLGAETTPQVWTGTQAAIQERLYATLGLTKAQIVAGLQIDHTFLDLPPAQKAEVLAEAMTGAIVREDVDAAISAMAPDLVDPEDLAGTILDHAFAQGADLAAGEARSREIRVEAKRDLKAAEERQTTATAALVEAETKPVPEDRDQEAQVTTLNGLRRVRDNWVGLRGAAALVEGSSELRQRQEADLEAKRGARTASAAMLAEARGALGKLVPLDALDLQIAALAGSLPGLREARFGVVEARVAAETDAFLKRGALEIAQEVLALVGKAVPAIASLDLGDQLSLLAPVVDHYTAQVTVAEEEERKLAEREDALDEDIIAGEKRAEEVGRSREARALAETAVNDAARSLVEVEAAVEELAEALAEERKLAEEALQGRTLDQIEAEVAGFDTKISLETMGLANLQARGFAREALSTAEDEVDVLTGKVEVSERLVEIFGPTGVRTKLGEGERSSLVGEANAILANLFDGRRELVLLHDPVDVMVDGVIGAHLSSAARTLVSASLQLALNARGQGAGVLVLDDAEHLDDGARDRLSEVLFYGTSLFESAFLLRAGVADVPDTLPEGVSYIHLRRVDHAAGVVGEVRAS